MRLLLLLSVVGVVSSQTCTKGQFYNDGGGNVLAKVGDGQCLGPSNGFVLNREVCICGCGFVSFLYIYKFFLRFLRLLMPCRSYSPYMFVVREVGLGVGSVCSQKAY